MRDQHCAAGDMQFVSPDFSCATPRGGRAFEVAGFGEFEAMLFGGTADQQRWLVRLGRLFDDVDVSGADLYDARVGQLREVLKATADLLEALAAACPGSLIVSPETLAAVSEVRQRLGGSR